MEKKTDFSFDNLETAFAHLSDKELKKTQSLFRLMHYPLLVKSGLWLSKMAFTLGLPVKGFVKKTVFHQFCGGETIASCRPIIALLDKFGVKSVLDYSVEGKKEEERLIAATEEIKRTIAEAGKNAHLAFAVFKVSGIADTELLQKVQEQKQLSEAEKESFAAARGRFMGLCDTAAQRSVRLLVDGEESWFQEIIDQWVEEAMRQYNKDKPIVFNTFQMYRKDMLRRLRDARHDAVAQGYFLGAKLVRGAYMENERANAKDRGEEDPIHPTKEATDNAYNEALKFCIDNKQRISLVSGSHNEWSNTLLAELVDLHGLSRSDERIYFSQLFGMSDPISFNLAKAGFNVVKYLPYGPIKEVLPYLARRVEENSGISGQASRELQRINQELRRRKSLPKLPKIA
ncbi:proline dehydrogenase family protein [Cyclobacterium jeungdonense]|uniref:Proline dehydrogenase family protein n=1 Tax=Cyclobacterium jeungdonense TaxID=708087 RepID=A0ABT8C516_9BACT|nr:proline dehydrogenase family protein [Cyclobacterium jeungdonense]MDN3686868.1 proline dehydrogenase family protein [Cyclobacterium jeungdonense]